MLCTFCGTENRTEYKFCGACGVRLERRQVDRRVRQAGISMKCPVCAYVNEPGLKFCGMCGTRIERRAQERRNGASEARAEAIANAQLPSPDLAGRAATQVAEPPERADRAPVSLPRRGEPAIFRNERSNGTDISGPSFLGLNSQADTNDNDVDYLLEDEPSRGGLRKLILLVILAAILGLVFVQWRSSFKASPKPTPATTEPAATPSPAPQGSNEPQNQGAAATSQPAADAAKTASTGASVSPPSDSATGGESKTQKTEPAASTSDPASTPVQPAAAAEKPPEDEEKNATVIPPASDSKPAEEPRLSDYKPSSALLRAQQYLRGHGVQQNCEQGLLYLHAAAEKSDPGAAIQMAALYSSGLCVKQDRVMAYRWFNSAHELQPGNMWIQKNMDQLWAQMSSQERRLAGY
jgi:hypothetical protein